MENSFRIKKENLKKVIPVLLERNVNFEVICNGCFPYVEEGMDDVCSSELGGDIVQLNIEMSGMELHRLLVRTCSSNLDTWE